MRGPAKPRLSKGPPGRRARAPGKSGLRDVFRPRRRATFRRRSEHAPPPPPPPSWQPGDGEVSAGAAAGGGAGPALHHRRRVGGPRRGEGTKAGGRGAVCVGGEAGGRGLCVWAVSIRGRAPGGDGCATVGCGVWGVGAYGIQGPLQHTYGTRSVRLSGQSVPATAHVFPDAAAHPATPVSPTRILESWHARIPRANTRAHARALAGERVLGVGAGAQGAADARRDPARRRLARPPHPGLERAPRAHTHTHTQTCTKTCTFAH